MIDHSLLKAGSASTYTGNLRALLKMKPERGAGLILTAVMERIEGGGSGKTAKSELLTGDAQQAFHMNKSGREPETYSEERLVRSGLEFHPSATVGLTGMYGAGLLYNSRRLLTAWTLGSGRQRCNHQPSLALVRSIQWGQVDDGHIRCSGGPCKKPMFR